jgi:type II secretory pathway pseudopilin PulG
VQGTTGNQRKASVPEIVGAWLHLWTAPRDVDIPPVPWRKLAIGSAVVAVVLGAALAIMVPRIDEGKQERAADARAQQARADVANRARVEALQRPHTGSAAELLPPAGASATEVNAARSALLREVETAITADAKARVAKGEMSSAKGPTTCRPSAGAREGVFDCFTVARHVPKVETNAAGSIGYPFRAVLDYDDFTYAFCRVEQFPGEMLVPDPRKVVQLPAACRR